MNLHENIMKYDYWWSSYGTVQLRYGGLSMESLLALVLYVAVHFRVILDDNYSYRPK